MNDCEEYLMHHGIKGQRWGIRRYQNLDGTLTSEGKQRYSVPTSLTKTHRDFKRSENYIKRKHAANEVGAYALSFSVPVAGALIGSKILSDSLHKANERRKELYTKYNPVKQQELIIEKGSKFNRTSTKQKEDGKERLFVGYEKDKFGKEYYTKTWPEILKKIKNDPNTKIYANSYEVKTELRAPSFEKRRKIAETLINTNFNLRKEMGRSYVMDQIRIKTGQFNLKTLNDAKKYYSIYKDKKEVNKFINNTVKEFDKKFVNTKSLNFDDPDIYQAFRATIQTNKNLMDAYIKELKKQGYNAVFDDNANTSASFIVFNPDDLTQTGSKML